MSCTCANGEQVVCPRCCLDRRSPKTGGGEGRAEGEPGTPTVNNLEDGQALSSRAAQAVSPEAEEAQSDASAPDAGKRQGPRLELLGALLAWAAWASYVAVACWHDFDRARLLLGATALAFCLWLWARVRELTGWQLEARLARLGRKASARPRALRALQAGVGFAVLALWVAVDVWRDPYRLVPVAGLLAFVGGGWALSQHPREVRWRPVLSGIMLQLVLGAFILRTHAGLATFQWLGDQVSAFLDHVEQGCQFVFGDEYRHFFFAFKVLPIIIYFSSVVSVAYHIGLLQYVFAHVAWVVQGLMGTSATESFVAAANIFIGQTEAPLLIKPFIKDQTLSEIHAVMTSGFATIAGGVMAAYISFGVPAEHLVAASVMSCPAALAMAKLTYPETEEPRRRVQSAADVAAAVAGSEDHNVIDAAASGACAAVGLVANIAANLIAFLSIWSFVDSAAGLAGDMVGMEGLSFELVCSYAFWPVAFLMGVPAGDCRDVAQLLGVKTFVNEFVAYRRMAELVADGRLSRRAEVITTYALCGFSNIGSIGVQLGSLGALAPERRHDMAGLVVRAMITGNVACFMTACVAAMLYTE